MCLNAGGMGRQDAESETLIPTNRCFFDETAHTLKADGFDASEDGTGRGTPIIPVAHMDTMPTMRAAASQDGPGHGARSGDSKDEYIVPVAFQSSQSGVRIDDVHATLDSNNGSRRHNGVVAGWAVRRLTPTECERLQGFPDNYTLIPWRKGEAPDGPRYKALGNSMAVNVMRWIGRRIEMVDALPAAAIAAE